MAPEGIAKKDLIHYRPAQESDKPFIFRSILLGTYHGNKPGKGSKPDPRCPVDYFSSIDQDVFMRGYHGYIEALFHRVNISISVACLAEDPDCILGFAVTEGNTLHFVFVKPQWRRIGIAKDLIPFPITAVTGFTRVGEILRRKRGWVFNPWA